MNCAIPGHSRDFASGTEAFIQYSQAYFPNVVFDVGKVGAGKHHETVQCRLKNANSLGAPPTNRLIFM